MVTRWLLCAVLLGLACAAPAHAVIPLRVIVEDVPGASAHRYAVMDSAGSSMDALKVVRSPFGGYLGVYHTAVAGKFTVKVARSVDLLHWTFRANLAGTGSQPTIYGLANGASLVAYESHTGCGGGGHCLALRYYATERALLTGAATRSLTLLPRLSACAEGTPNIFAAASDLSSIDIGFHYSQGCRVDRQARGRLLRFNPTTWTPIATAGIDSAILAAGASAGGDIADRDGNLYDGSYQRLYEAQVAPIASWRGFLLTGAVVRQLAVHTHGGSRGFSHPTFTPLTLPSGEPGVVVTQIVTAAGAAPGEAGELVYYRPEEQPLPPPSGDPTIGAAGDISCASSDCHDDETSNMLMANTPTRVLTLGDNQYESGSLDNYNTYFAPDWGRLRSITMPAPGNHDPPSSGYSAYWGVAPNYSFDLGKWHLISLDSTGVANAAAFLKSDLAGRTNRCTLAFWHHPRFSSGNVHGNNPAMGPLWDLLYAAHADVVLNGHEHSYERFAPQTPAGVNDQNGLREFVVGTGGNDLYGFGTPLIRSVRRVSGVHGVLRMTLHPTSYDWRFQGEDGVIYDSGSSLCS